VYNDANLVSTGRQKLEGGAGPWLAGMSAKLLPGRYRVRAAVRDRLGRAGVVERSVDVGLRGSAQLQFSDLLVGVADAQGRLTPSSRITHGATLSALIESVSADPAVFEQLRMVLEIIPGGSATPAKRFVMATRNGSSGAIVNNIAEIPTMDLPEGRYTAVATATRGDQPIARVTRIFEITK
jgi:hypothetical protein